MSGWTLSGWAAATVLALCAAAGWWHHRRGAARVARCAHELRGSLGALRLGLDLALRRDSLGADSVRGLDLQLTRATLTLAELDGRRMWRVPERVEPVELSRLARECVAALGPLGASRGVEVGLGEVYEGAVSGSRGALAQALSNLIQNAVEHGAGPVRVHVRRGRNTLRLEVADGGPGLGRPLRECLAPGRIRRWAPGASPHGHGLRVAASVAAAHGGHLLAAPSRSGCRLVLELPVAGSADGRAPLAHLPAVWSSSTSS